MIERTVGGFQVDAIDAIVQALLVRDTISAGEQGRGMTLQDSLLVPGQAPNVTFYGSAIERTQDVGIVQTGGYVGLDGVRVSDTNGIGVNIQSGESGRGSGYVFASLIERSQRMGVNMLGSDGTVDESAIIDVEPTHIFGRGVNVQYSFTTRERAVGLIKRTLIERANEGGVITLMADATIEDSIVRDTGTLTDGTMGDGYSVHAATQEASLTLIKSMASGSARAGAASFGGLISLRDSRFECNAIALNGESNPFAEYCSTPRRQQMRLRRDHPRRLQGVVDRDRAAGSRDNDFMMRWLLVLMLLLPACGDDDETADKACTKDADCDNGLCISDADGKKTCSSTGPSGGW